MQESRWFVRARALAHTCRATALADDASLTAVGFKRVPAAGVPVSPATLPVSLFVPLFFPIEQTHGASPYDWSKAPAEITVVAVVESQERYRCRHGEAAVLWRDLDAFRHSCCDERAQRALADATATYIRASVDNLREAFDLGALNREVRLEVVGHSQGGAIAAAATLALFSWAQDVGMDLYCTTFDAPGVHSCHLRSAVPQKHVWEERVVNFVCDPNQINTINRHVGRIIHLRGRRGERGGWTWTVRSLVMEALRIVAVMLLGRSGVRKRLAEWVIKSLKDVKRRIAVLLLSSGALTQIWRQLEQRTAWLSHLVIGETPEDMAARHSLPHVIECLASRHEPSAVIEMQTWPQRDALNPSLSEILLLLVLMHLPFWPTSVGVRFAFDKEQLMSNRLLLLRGYKPRA